MAGESALPLHTQIVAGTFRSPGRLVNFEPLSWEEYKSYSAHDKLHHLDPTVGAVTWLRPIQRLLQETFQIDQRAYSTGTDPTLAELTEDFNVAATLTVDKFAQNPDDVYGQESVDGASRKWSHQIPDRARMLLNRYEFSGNRSNRT